MQRTCDMIPPFCWMHKPPLWAKLCKSCFWKWCFSAQAENNLLNRMVGVFNTGVVAGDSWLNIGWDLARRQQQQTDALWAELCMGCRQSPGRGERPSGQQGVKKKKKFLHHYLFRLLSLKCEDWWGIKACLWQNRKSPFFSHFSS